MGRLRRLFSSFLASGVLLLAGCPSGGGGTMPDLRASCADDSQCTAPTGHCDGLTKTCVACTMDPHCPDGQLCVMNKCVPGCSQTKGCGDAGMCDTTSGKCTSCTADTDCKDGMSPRCDTKSGRCVPCLPGDTDNCGTGRYCIEMNGSFMCGNGCGKDADCKAGDGGGGGGTAACCNHVCLDTTVDNKNCGACGKACANGTVCCNGACVNTATDAANCGACGRSCAGVANGSASCVNAKCTILSCNNGYADCDNDYANGCEVNKQSDVRNCGGCGIACAQRPNATPACAAQSCSFSCNLGYTDCDLQAQNGCEAQLAGDPNIPRPR